VKSVKPFFYIFVFLFLVLISFRYWWLESRTYTALEKEITLIGKVVVEPEVDTKNTKLTIKEGGGRTSTLVFAPRYPEYKYGDVLEIKGKIEKPTILRPRRTSLGLELRQLSKN
jgi:hypothetical protein